MSTTANHPRRNQEPEPVRPWFARLFSRTPRRSIASQLPSGSEIAAAFERGVRRADDLRTAREEATRWKDHADSYERERDGAYRERAQLLAWLAALHPSSAVITQSPDVDEDGWQLLYLVAGGWQMSWHIHPRDADLFRHVPVVDVTDPRAQWDGHGTLQKYERMANHVRLLALDQLGADGATTPVMTPPATVDEPRSA
ncbi:hypothetical protein ABZZ79_02940 [Streptomyces sp. NPDC006458]|uniref:hypothetical protein n=1 Tax=Streptomyces sp. NPDC006458 TaxID=3154302 RepID=UPI0033BD66D3